MKPSSVCMSGVCRRFGSQTGDKQSTTGMGRPGEQWNNPDVKGVESDRIATGPEGGGLPIVWNRKVVLIGHDVIPTIEIKCWDRGGGSPNTGRRERNSKRYIDRRAESYAPASKAPKWL